MPLCSTQRHFVFVVRRIVYNSGRRWQKYDWQTDVSTLCALGDLRQPVAKPAKCRISGRTLSIDVKPGKQVMFKNGKLWQRVLISCAAGFGLFLVVCVATPFGGRLVRAAEIYNRPDKYVGIFDSAATLTTMDGPKTDLQMQRRERAQKNAAIRSKIWRVLVYGEDKVVDGG